MEKKRKSTIKNYDKKIETGTKLNYDETIPPVVVEVEKKIVSVKDSYLPAVLVKAKICKNNAEARKLIRSEAISVNGKTVNNCDVTNAKLQFVVKYDNVEYEIFKV